MAKKKTPTAVPMRDHRRHTTHRVPPTGGPAKPKPSVARSSENVPPAGKR